VVENIFMPCKNVGSQFISYSKIVKIRAKKFRK